VRRSVKFFEPLIGLVLDISLAVEPSGTILIGVISNSHLIIRLTDEMIVELEGASGFAMGKNLGSQITKIGLKYF